MAEKAEIGTSGPGVKTLTCDIEYRIGMSARQDEVDLAACFELAASVLRELLSGRSRARGTRLTSRFGK